MTQFYVCVPLAKEPTRLQIEALNITHGRFVSDLARKTDGQMVCPVVRAEELTHVSHACRVEIGSTGGLELVREERAATPRKEDLDALYQAGERLGVAIRERDDARAENAKLRAELDARLGITNGGAS